MSSKLKSSAALAAIASLASNALFAQAPPTLVVAFSGPTVAAVPLGAWSSVGAALAIVAAAYALLRHRRGGNFGRLSAWFLVAIASAGAVLAASRVDFIAAAQAVSVPILTLTTSPASIALGGGSAMVEVDNGTNIPLRIESITLQNPAQGQQIVPFPGANCVVGLTLPVRGSCFVAINAPAPG